MPATIAYALAVWLLCGVLSNHWWWQIGCFAVTTYLMVQLNNANVLIRIFSRMVSSSFLALSCASCFLFPFLREAVMITCLTAFTLLFFYTYQEITNTMSISWRTGTASLLGLLTPYWFGCIWLLYRQDYSLLTEHFTALAVFDEPFNLYGITDSQKATLALIILMAVIGTIHFIRKNYLDKIRVRMFYGFFIWMDLAALAFLLLQPQHFNAMLLIMILNTSPLVAHFAALSSTKLTNITFMTLCIATLLLTIYNIWMFSSLS